MRVAVPAEIAPDERRVALTPESVGRLTKAGAEIRVQQGAGERAGFLDDAYRAAGAVLVEDARALLDGAGVVVKVRRPSPDEVAQIAEGATLIALLQPGAIGDLLPALVARRITALALELVPRISRAQSMDVLSSQSTVAGYKAVLVGAVELGKFLPMLTTAAGSIPPARAFVVGVGVAGLQAIATARRLGAVVSAFDVRAAAREQVQSLGASFVAAELVSAEAEDKGGYARQQSADQQALTLAAIARHIVDQDLVITTAQVPGRRAPLLITGEMVRAMRPGSVIVDLAAEAGGNCALTRAGERVVERGVVILGPVNLPATVPLHASQMFSKNVLTLLVHLIKDGELHIDPNDEIVRPMLITHEGTSRS
jgi:H+-translocating NAD(P) transhydrogenase subunit alpha